MPDYMICPECLLPVRKQEQHLAAAESGATPAGYRLQPIIEYEAMNKIVEDHSRLEQRLAAAEARIAELVKQKSQEPEQGECYVDYELGAEIYPTCVFDTGAITDCEEAINLHADGKGKKDCQHWRVIATDGVSLAD